MIRGPPDHPAMDERLGSLVVALLVVAAIGSAAATVDDGERAGGGVGERTEGETGRPGSLPGGGDEEGAVTGEIGPVGPGSGDGGRGFGGLALPLGVALGALLWVGLAVGVLRRATGDDRRRPVDDDDDRDGAADVGGGSGPDRPRRPAATNGVAAAWVELVRRVDGDVRRTTTPGELAVRAVEAGYDRDGVRELTALFERVRYGAAAPTDERVAGARDALARSCDGAGGDGRGRGREPTPGPAARTDDGRGGDGDGSGEAR